MGLFKNLHANVFSSLLILTLSFASSRGTQIEILNNCTYTVWAAANPGGGRQLNHGEAWTLNDITGEGRIWGRTNCAFGIDGHGKCESGDCDGRLECQANGSTSSAKCSKMGKCAADVNGACPMELRDPGGCNNPCTVFGNSQFCCTSESICQPTSCSQFFRDLCPDAFTFPSDFGQRRIYPSGSTDYKAVFCPSTIDKNQKFSQDYLIAHNKARAEVQVPPLTWNTTVENYAREQANKHVADCTLEHSHGLYDDENLAGSTGDLSCSDAVNLWVSEKADHNYTFNSCASGKACGHYIRVVWRDSVHVGCARVRCDNNRGIFIKCNYFPRGSFGGERPY